MRHPPADWKDRFTNAATAVGDEYGGRVADRFTALAMFVEGLPPEVIEKMAAALAGAPPGQECTFDGWWRYQK